MAATLVSPKVSCSVRDIIVLYSVFCLVLLAVKFPLKLLASSFSEVLVVSARKVGSGEVFSNSRPSKGVSGLVGSAGVYAETKGTMPVFDRTERSLF